MSAEIRRAFGLGDAGPAEADRADAPRAAAVIRQQTQATADARGAKALPPSGRNPKPAAPVTWRTVLFAAGSGLILYGIWRQYRD